MPVALYDALDRSVKMLKEHEDLPEPVTVSQTVDGLWITPWKNGAPCQALLAWAELIEEPHRAAQKIEYEDDAYWKLTITGRIGEVPVVCSVTTWNEPKLSANDTFTTQELRRLANEERAF